VRITGAGDAVERWREPDRGIWEWPGEPQHFTHSKVMCWTAADRGLRLAEACMRKAPERRWRKARDEIADGTLSHGNRIIGTMARIPFIFVAVVSLGFIAMLVALADMRKKEFALLRSVGATRWHLVRSLTASALKVALVSVLAGTVFGALAGWLFTAATRAAMANWGIPPNFAVPADVIARGAVAAIGFALAVAVPAAAVIVYRATGRRVVDKGAA
jgi:predicted lysophospholipase L1 biosynthesis ABC-type transport system permease subunit